jgi:hypothetical protein
MKWFRFWTDTLDDVKILGLSDYEYRIWTYLLAIASEVNSMSGECQVNVKSMSLRCRTQVNHFSRALETFQRVGLITINGDGYPVICNWSKRQFKSDDVTARVHKHREVTTKRNVSCNVSETDQITDTDTDTDITPIVPLKGDESKDQSKKEKKSKPEIKIPPTLEDVTAYCRERGRGINAQAWMDFYASKGWMVGANKMKDWKAAVRTWEHSRGGNGNVGIRTSRSDPRDASLQSREDAEVQSALALWEAAKKSPGSDSPRDAKNDDAPDFSGE